MNVMTGWVQSMVVIPVIVILAGCAPGARPYWLHQASTPQLWARDSYECERQAQIPGMAAGVPIGSGIVVGVPMGTTTDSGVMQRCLEARGWRLVYR